MYACDSYVLPQPYNFKTNHPTPVLRNRLNYRLIKKLRLTGFHTHLTGSLRVHAHSALHAYTRTILLESGG